MTTKEQLLEKVKEVDTLLKEKDCVLSEEKTQKIEKYLNETLFIIKLSPREEFLKSKLLDVFPIKYLAKWLSYRHINTVEDLINKTRSDILNIRNIGPKTIKLIEDWMTENNLFFRED